MDLQYGIIFWTFTTKFLQERSAQIKYLKDKNIGTSSAEQLMAIFNVKQMFYCHNLK